MRFIATMFVEGEWDKKFLKDFVKNSFGFDLPSGAIQITGGKEALHTKKERLIESRDSGFKNLVIIDANGSFNKTRDFIEKQKDNLRIDFEYFIMPNNGSIGDLETLLENIAASGNRFVLDCFEDYLKCLKNSNRDLKYPKKKTKIYAYLSLLNEKTEPDLVNYLNKDLWNLGSPYLKPLYNFLKPYFVE